VARLADLLAPARPAVGAKTRRAAVASFASVELSKLFGLPAHPLVVHLPIVLVPLAALGALAIAVVPAWRARFGVLTVAIATVALVGVQLAMGSGEELEDHVDRSAILHRHTELAESLRPMVFVFLVLLVAFVVLDRRRPGWLSRPLLIGLATLTVFSGGVSTVRLVQVGHNGARATWHETDMSKRRADNDRDGD